MGVKLFGSKGIWEQGRQTKTSGARMFGSKGPLKVRVRLRALGGKSISGQEAGQNHFGERAFGVKGIWCLERLGVRVFWGEGLSAAASS